MEQIAWNLRERWELMRCTAAKAEAVFGTISLLWGCHIFAFGGKDIVAQAMRDLLPIRAWGVAMICVGLAQFYGAFYCLARLRVNATFCNMTIMLFVTVAFIRGRVWTPGVFICPGYTIWLYEIYRYLRAKKHGTPIQ